jgi:hypothetical protein
MGVYASPGWEYFTPGAEPRTASGLPSLGELTPRQRQFLRALCRPRLLGKDRLATNAEIAAELETGEKNVGYLTRAVAQKWEIEADAGVKRWRIGEIALAIGIERFDADA